MLNLSGSSLQSPCVAAKVWLTIFKEGPGPFVVMGAIHHAGNMVGKVAAYVEGSRGEMSLSITLGQHQVRCKGSTSHLFFASSRPRPIPFPSLIFRASHGLFPTQRFIWSMNPERLFFGCNNGGCFN